MIKILDSKNKNFDKTLDTLLSKRKNKVQLNSVSVIKIIKDVKKNGDKAILKYEKRFNKNSVIAPSIKQINKTALASPDHFNQLDLKKLMPMDQFSARKLGFGTIFAKI